jgi:hypothetical protein
MGENRSRSRELDRLEVGQRIRDTRWRQEGTVLDVACQYAHPKADPVFSYLVRWEDGQVHAISEGAFWGDHGFELLD